MSRLRCSLTVPAAQTIEKIVEIPVAQTAQSTQTSESLGTSLVCQMMPAETMEMVELRAPFSAESGLRRA